MNKMHSFDTLDQQLAALLQGERDALANTANFVALLYDATDAINWLGIYVARDNELVLGPFQGRPACVRIPFGRGVCGTSAVRKETLVVKDVHTFDDHIVCDPVSRSEIVVPLMLGQRLLGVLDVDSPEIGRFDDEDRAGLERLCQRYVDAIAESVSSDGYI